MQFLTSLILYVLVSTGQAVETTVVERGHLAFANSCRALLEGQGEVRGEWFADFPTCVYKGIPYATPPLGSLRFAAPQPPKKFPQGVYDAKKFGPGCIQTCDLPRPEMTCPKSFSEDCLTVNVFTPRNQEESYTLASLPVIVFIHGGNYIAGAGGVKLYHGSRWASAQEVLIVTFNYRLGVLGGLYTKRGSIHGNFHLQDQRMLLRWVQQNIQTFGGDPYKVTISGQSAGGFAVASHLASPRSWSLFQHAIVMSDPVALPTETESKSQMLSESFVRYVGCYHWWETIEEEEECLRNLSEEVVLTAQERIKFPLRPGMILHQFMPWTPVVDGVELPLSPIEAAIRGKLAPVPVIIGSVANEAVQFIWKASSEPTSKLDYELFMLAIFGVKNSLKVFKAYGPPVENETHDREDTRPFLAQIGTDYIFTCSIRSFAFNVAKTQPVYVYLYNHLDSFNVYIQNQTDPECIPYVCHGTDLSVLFNTFFLSPDGNHPILTPEEEVLSAKMQALWANFAANGDPNALHQHPWLRGSNMYSMPVFPHFNPTQNQSILSMGIPFETINNFRKPFCDVFDTIGYEIN